MIGSLGKDGLSVSGALAASSSLPVLVAIYWFQLGYVPGLIVAFICFLSLTHFAYASNSKLNQRMARMIDYWYLGVAAIGLFVFVLAYSGQRDLLYDKAVVAAYLLNEGERRADMVKVLTAISETMCRDNIVAKSRVPCDNAKVFHENVKPGMTGPQIAEVEDKFVKVVWLPYDLLFEDEQKKRETGFDLPLAAVQLRFDMWRDYVLRTPPIKEPDANEMKELVFGVGQMLIWPFLLAAALALRLTKVTIDVYGWADG